MASSLSANSHHAQAPVCGCNRSMKMFMSNSVENPKRRFWKCQNSRLIMSGCNLVIWDDDLERNPASDLRSSSGCNCSKMLKDLGSIVKEIDIGEKAKMKTKLEKDKRKATLLKLLLVMSWGSYFLITNGGESHLLMSIFCFLFLVFVTLMYFEIGHCTI
ncbi:unnamed protein product [Lathyrus sativus]|nr:unnamed protein product [Lathyrus sativus]